jgi:hypothetical protein
MSDETYYTVLNVKETASPAEIKTAYRDLIKQVHPDTIANLAPFLRKIAEDKAKEINEAYGVLSNSSKRQDYDRQLAAYRRQSASHAPSTPQAPPTSQAPPTPPQQPSRCPICVDGVMAGHSAACVNYRTSQASTSSGPYCNQCGTSLYVSGFCPKCSKFATPSPTPLRPQAVRKVGYNWAPLKRWAREHPFVVVFAVLFSVIFIASFFDDANTSQSSANTSQSSESKPPSTNNAALASAGLYSKYPCDFRDKISPIDGKPCEGKSGKATEPQMARDFSDIDQFVQDQRTSSSNASNFAIASVSGTYIGTVYNQTANFRSTFTVVIHQTKDGALDGCVKFQPPLYIGGVLHGSILRSHVNFVVADTTFQGDASKTGITGSYVVTRQAGNQSGDFRLTKQTWTKASYGCTDGAAGEFEVVDTPPKPKPVVKIPAATFAVVTGQYGATIYKRCAFLPLENYGRCDYGPEEIAELKQGDRVRVLSPLTRAQNGDDIYKVRTQQGWEGWARAGDITFEQQ